jgi:hypothetical protein
MIGWPSAKRSFGPAHRHSRDSGGARPARSRHHLEGTQKFICYRCSVKFEANAKFIARHISHPGQHTYCPDCRSGAITRYCPCCQLYGDSVDDCAIQNCPKRYIKIEPYDSTFAPSDERLLTVAEWESLARALDARYAHLSGRRREGRIAANVAMLIKSRARRRDLINSLRARLARLERKQECGLGNLLANPAAEVLRGVLRR